MLCDSWPDHARILTIEKDKQPATPEEVLSRYIGWGGLADAFDGSKPAWATEYKELQAMLTPEEYAAARFSTLNAHYTSPTTSGWAIRRR
jgi:hypothetical protein